MPVLSNNGRLISSLPITSTVSGQDELLLQSNGVTKRISYASLSGSILSSNNFNPFNTTVNFTSTNNKFTGSFYSPDFKSSNFYTVAVRNTLTGNAIIATSGFSGNLSGNVVGDVTGTVTGTLNGNVTGNVTGNITGNVTSTGTSTFSSIDVNGGAIDGTAIGASSATTIIGTTITATNGFSGNLTGTVNGNVTGAVTGNVTGDLIGDVYNSTATKVLESGNTTPTTNGGVASAYFYGTSSYANQALTAAYAAAGGSAINGIPSGGSQYQILAKKTGTSYDVIWTNQITSSNPGNPNNIVVWDNNRSIRDYNNFYWNGVYYNCDTNIRAKGFDLSGGAFTGSFVGNSQTITIEAGNLYRIIDGDQYPSVLLRLSSSGYCTMSLMRGQTSTVLVQNSGNYKVLKWSGSLDGGTTANTKIYWKNGLSASITQGDKKKDIITFVNIDNRIFGSAINNFQ